MTIFWPGPEVVGISGTHCFNKKGEYVYFLILTEIVYVQPSSPKHSESQVGLVVHHVPVEGLPEGHEPRAVQMALVPG